MKSLWSRWRSAWLARARHERIILIGLSILVSGVLAALYLQAAAQGRARLGASVSQLRAQSATLEAQAREYIALRAIPLPALSTRTLRTLLQDRITAAGLERTLVSIQAPDPDHVKAVFGALPFAEWITLIGDLQAQGIRLEECRLESLTSPGMVGATATFARARR